MTRRLRIQDRALGPMAEVVHVIDRKDGKYRRSETDGFNALPTGLVAAHSADDQRITQGLRLFDKMYAYCQRKKRE